MTAVSTSNRFCLMGILFAFLFGTSTAVGQNGFQNPRLQNPGFTYVPVATSSLDPYATSATPAGFLPGNNFGAPNLGAVGGLLPSPMSLSERLWLKADYLYWITSGMDLPALVTTSTAGTPQATAGVLGEPNTSVVFGNQDINDDGSSGARLRAGFWLTQQRTFAIESEFFKLLGNRNDGFSGGGDGRILARPFFDVAPGRSLETAQLIEFDGVVDGRINIRSDSELRSFLINGRVGLCPIGVCGSNGLADRVDWIIGYRYIDLDESLSFQETLISEVLAAPGTIALTDSFRTRNEFNGLQLGVIHQANFRRAWLESVLRVAVGHNSQSVGIAGSTSITELGVTDTFNGGLLAQRSNIGSYDREQFTMVPEIGFTLGVHLTDWLDATLGYSVLYYPSVVRPGDQISSDVNGNLIAPETVPFAGTLRPQFQYVESDYTAHGLSLGAEVRF